MEEERPDGHLWQLTLERSLGELEGYELSAVYMTRDGGFYDGRASGPFTLKFRSD